MAQNCGDHDGTAKHVANIATAQAKAAVIDGTAGKTMTITKDIILRVFHDVAKKKGKAPGPDSLTYLVLGCLGESGKLVPKFSPKA